MQAQMLAPAAVLVVWTLIMLTWLAATRLPPLFKQPGGLGSAKRGGRGQDLEGVLPDSVQWKSHNYTHLLEQPTLFYAASVIITIMGAEGHDVVVQRADEQAHADDAVADDHHGGEDGVAGQRVGVVPAPQHDRDDQRGLDDGDGQRQDQGPLVPRKLVHRLRIHLAGMPAPFRTGHEPRRMLNPGHPRLPSKRARLSAT